MDLAAGVGTAEGVVDFVGGVGEGFEGGVDLLGGLVGVLVFVGGWVGVLGEGGGGGGMRIWEWGLRTKILDGQSARFCLLLRAERRRR